MAGRQKEDRNAFLEDGEVENLWINVASIGASETVKVVGESCHSFTTDRFK